MSPIGDFFVFIGFILVFIMMPGLALFYGGLVERDKTLSIMKMVVASLIVCGIQWITVGYSMVFGSDIYGLIGNPLDHFLLRGISYGDNVFSGTEINTWIHFLFFGMFAIITPALIAGAFVGRLYVSMRYIIFLVLWSTLIYSPIAHWLWGGGFLSEWGAIDFAGGMVVHISAGMSALAVAWYFGKRKAIDIPPHNIPYVAWGALFLWFGWFGFNGASALAWDNIAKIAIVNTFFAPMTATLVWWYMSWNDRGKPSFVYFLTGMIAGLVAITPAAGYVTPQAAMAIGAIAGFACWQAMKYKAKWGWDDALDVWAVHGVGGIVGSVVTGIFASPYINSYAGLYYGGMELFKANLWATSVGILYSFIMTFPILFVVTGFKRKTIDVGESWDRDLLGEVAYTRSSGSLHT